MAKKTYIGISGVARKVKKMYVGIGGVARKVKKAYIGIAGVARAFFGGGELRYYGTANTSLTRSTPTALSVARSDLSATTVGNYGLFGGGGKSGSGSSSYFNTVDAYNTSLTRNTPNNLYTKRYNMAATTVSNYALFGGGVAYNSTIGMGQENNHVDAYDTSLTRSAPTSLSKARYNLSATTVGDYALFGGGYAANDVLDKVDAYNTSLTQSVATALSQARQYLLATTVGNYALFGGGIRSQHFTNKKHTYCVICGKI